MAQARPWIVKMLEVYRLLTNVGRRQPNDSKMP